MGIVAPAVPRAKKNADSDKTRACILSDKPAIFFHFTLDVFLVPPVTLVDWL